MGKVTIQDIDLGMKKIFRDLEDNAEYVEIGIQSDESEKLLIIAAANEFGAEIDHPGGTSYGYKTKNHAKKGKVSFLKKGSGYMELGITKPHKIVIPPRSYIRSTIDQFEEKYADEMKKLAGRLIDGQISKREALSLLGLLVENDIKNTIVNLSTPPNAPGTIRKKGSDNPLVNTGLLGGSIRYVVKTK